MLQIMIFDFLFYCIQGYINSIYNKHKIITPDRVITSFGGDEGARSVRFAHYHAGAGKRSFGRIF